MLQLSGGPSELSANMDVIMTIFHRAPPPFLPAGSVYRDEFDLAILKMQEDNRLEILKRKWWDGGKCPKEEDHRAKGSPAAASVYLAFIPLQFPSSGSHLSPYAAVSRSGDGEHRRDLRGAGVWPAGGYLHGRAGVCLDVKAGPRK